MSPRASARYSRCTVRAASCRTRSVCAVERLRDDQEPARVLVEPVDDARARHARRAAARDAAARSAAFPPRLPLPGCTTSPAGLSSTSSASSSWTIASAIASGATRRAGVGLGLRVTTTRSPPRTFASAPPRDRRASRGRRRSRPAAGCANTAAARARAPRRSASGRVGGERQRVRLRARAAGCAWRRARAHPVAVRAVGQADRGCTWSYNRAFYGHARTAWTDRRLPSPIRTLGARASRIVAAVAARAAARSRAAACCPRSRTRPPAWSADALQDAHDALLEGNYTRAVKLFETLESRFPYGRYAQQAILESAYANYRAGETAAAVAAAIGSSAPIRIIRTSTTRIT